MTAERLDTEFEHEHVSVFQDPETGAVGVVAIHSTALGPAMGGLRLFPYPTLSDAIVDVLRLSRAMSLKNAAAGLSLGGGKAVIVDDGEWTTQRPARMRAVGEAIERLGGRYVTAEDVGTTPADMDQIATVTKHVAGLSPASGGRGNPSPSTARTVFGAIESAVRVRFGCSGLDGIRVGVYGTGQVGTNLVALLARAGASVSVTDVDRSKAMAVGAEHGVPALPLEGFMMRDFDVLAPCAMGGAIDGECVPGISAAVIAGGANNPLGGVEVAGMLAAREILYVPDFLANCGGIIHVGAEALDLPAVEAERLIDAALVRTETILREAVNSARLPLEVAEEYATSKMRDGRFDPARRLSPRPEVVPDSCS